MAKFDCRQFQLVQKIYKYKLDRVATNKENQKRERNRHSHVIHIEKNAMKEIEERSRIRISNEDEAIELTKDIARRLVKRRKC